MTQRPIDDLLDALTLEEQVALLAGASAWTTTPVPRVGVPAIKVTDGPNGARGAGGLVGGVPAACFPVGIALAATWDVALVREVGGALAEETRTKGARVLLAPTVNIHRSPLAGRTFECYAEDPHLTSRMAVAAIGGLQEQGIAATVKHFVGNESEFERMSLSSEIDERSLREIYLPPFEAAVTEARVWAIMSAYNKLNGTYAGEHPRLLTTIAREEWGFDGLMMSDWFGTYSTAAAVEAGQDLEMPGPTRWRGPALVAAVRAGEVAPDAVRRSAARLLRLLERVGALRDPAIPDERAVDRPEHRALIRRAGAAGIVLLKNDRALLPLDAGRLRSVAVIGPNAAVARIMGGGSARVNAHHRVSPLEGIRARAGDGVRVLHEVGCSNERLVPLLPGPVDIAYFGTPDLSGPELASEQDQAGERLWAGDLPEGLDPMRFSARLVARLTPDEDGEHRFGLASAGRSRLFVDGSLLIDAWEGWRPGDTYFGQGSDERRATLALQAGRSYELRVEFGADAPVALPIRAVRVGVTKPLGDDALARAAAAAAGADVALVCVGLNDEWDSEGVDRPHMDLPGRQNELVERVVAANPNTVVVLQSGSPVTMPWLPRVPALLQAWYPGQECGDAIADVLFGDVNPSGRLPLTFPARLEDNPTFLAYPGENGRVRYAEGLFVGYRYYDAKRVTPLFPFGFGLSYTRFEYGEAVADRERLAPGDAVTVRLDVTNGGDRAGAEVVQVYVRDPRSTLQRPPKELKGFVKLFLEPGETRTVRVALDMRALAFFDDARAAWVAEAGDFEVLVGASATDIRTRAVTKLEADWVHPVGQGAGGPR